MGEQKELKPIGGIGEICIGGIGLANGYVNKGIMTQEKFIKNPFFPKGKLYKTGDLGKWLPSGELVFLGRSDDQVKINGYRIELGEIEQIVQQSGMVQQIVVLLRENNAHHKYLVGYIVERDLFDKEQLIQYLHGKLPSYMIPNIWKSVPDIPMTKNGKVDKFALSRLEVGSAADLESIPPRNIRESALVEIWKELLEVDQVSVYDNFFALGGHSFLVFQLLMRTKELKYEIDYKDIFRYQTINSLAQYLERQGNRPGHKVDTSHNGLRTKIPSSQNVHQMNKIKGNDKLFLLPGAPGFCYGYGEFAERFDDTYDMYGIQFLGLNEGENPQTDISEIANLTREWIQAIQPEGPYRFIGHSFGVFVAFGNDKTIRKGRRGS